MNVLYLTDKLNHTDGVSSHLFYLLKNLKSFDVKLHIICSGGDSIDKFKSLNIGVYTYDKLEHNKRSVLNFLKSVKFVSGFCKENKIDIVNSHNHYCANIAKTASKIYKLRTIQTIHGIISVSGKFKLYVSDFFIGVNKHITDFLLENKIASQNNSVLIFNGIDFAEEFFKTGNPIIKVIAASRLVKEKGLDTFIKAVSMINEKFRSSAEFIIAGEGEYEAELKSINSELNAEVIFTGCIKDMINKFESTDVFVLPTVSDSEGLPMTVLEAASAKNLILSSDFKGSSYIFNDGSDSLIFKKNDAQRLTHLIEYAIENKNMRTDLSEAFYRKAKLNFNASTMSEKHFELYTNLMQHN